MLGALEGAGLRGLGGAGFPAARKWRLVREHPGPRHVVVNADEGEPGTFKDRHCLESDPHRVLEGMLLAAAAVGRCRLLDLPARRIPAPPSRPVARDRGAGGRRAGDDADPPAARARAYICGEESAMLESLEGKRGLPCATNRPSPVQVGLFGRPTLIHNVETVYWLRDPSSRSAGPNGSWRRGGTAPERAAQRLGLGPGAGAGRQARACRDHGAQSIDQYCGGMAEGHTFKGYLPGGGLGRHPPRPPRRPAARFRHARTARLLHWLGGGRRPFRAGRPPARSCSTC